jgi:prepilin-type N-terminal cleavage/methylation domain-containing protein
MSRQKAWEDERGFTLIELVLVIVLMGLVFGIVAFSSWFGVAEGRRVDSATNQLAADLRQAHSRATNRLAPHTVTLFTGSSEYTMTGTADPLDLDDCDDEDVAEGRCDDEDVVVVDTGATVVFNADGSAVVTGANPITVESSDDPAKYNHTIGINITTSRIQVVP